MRAAFFNLFRLSNLIVYYGLTFQLLGLAAKDKSFFLLGSATKAQQIVWHLILLRHLPETAYRLCQFRQQEPVFSWHLYGRVRPVPGWS